MTSLAEIRVTRAALLAAVLAVASGAVLADEVSTAAPAGVGPAPWAKVAVSPAFAPDDAYLFADPAAPARLEDDAAAAAYLIDRERLAVDAELDDPDPAPLGRVAAAFSDFTSYGSDGESYASVALARAGAAARVAAGSVSTPSLAAFALASR